MSIPSLKERPDAGTGRKTLRAPLASHHSTSRRALAVVANAQPDLRTVAQSGYLVEVRGPLLPVDLREADALARSPIRGLDADEGG